MQNSIINHYSLRNTSLNSHNTSKQQETKVYRISMEMSLGDYMIEQIPDQKNRLWTD